MIQDSGKRREFETGAVRDISEGKGRCDLLPLDIITHIYSDKTIAHIAEFIKDPIEYNLYKALGYFILELGWEWETALLELSIHFEEGCDKYSSNDQDMPNMQNWQKGIPIHCYIDSAVRHYLKWRRGDEDERHDRAVLWNFMCCIWTIRHKPEMNDI